jgi:hypothetical protein
MRELHFEEVPDPEVRFRGSTMRNSVWRSSRENVPDRVREGVVYRNAGVRLRIASEIIESGSVFESTLDKERVKTNLGHQGRKPARVRPQEYRGEEK